MAFSIKTTEIRCAALGLTIVLFCGSFAAMCPAAVIDLYDRNSHVQIDPASQDGMKQWTVNGVNYDAKQWFWYRVGGIGGESSLDTLELDEVVPLNTNGDLDIDQATLNFSNHNGLSISVQLSLQGSNAGSSSIMETIWIKNTTGDALDLHFFQYNNFTLSDANDTVVFEDSNYVLQTAPVGTLSETIGTNSGEGFVTGDPLHEAALVSATLDSLNNTSPTILNGVDTAGPGNVSWAFQWDVSLENNGEFIISKGKTLDVVPEPSMISLLCVSVVALGGLSWRMRR
jgi:hypothetical protein